MTPQLDPLAALRLFLLADDDLATDTGGRIYVGELPEADQREMPRRAIVLRGSGGTGTIGQAYQEYGDGRVDVFVYGVSPGDAMELWQSVNPLLKQLRREVHGGCLLHWARPGGFPIPLRDPDTDWPYTLNSYQVMAAEQSAA